MQFVLKGKLKRGVGLKKNSFRVIYKLATLLIFLFAIISLARKNGLDHLGVKYSISSFLFAVLIYLLPWGMSAIFSMVGFSFNFFSSRIFGLPFYLWVTFILFLLSLFFSIKAWRSGGGRIAIFLMVFDVILLLYIFELFATIAWINAML